MRSLRPQVAIDLGTAFIRVATDRCEVETIPVDSVPAPPLRSGVVSDPNAVADLLRPCLERARKWSVLSPRVVVGAPSDVQEQERVLLRTAMHHAGAGVVEIVAEPCAAALGAALDLSSPYAQMIVDVGEGVTDCAILRAGELLASRAVRLGCADLGEKVRHGLGLNEGQVIGPREAARIVQTVGVAGQCQAPEHLNITLDLNGMQVPLVVPGKMVQEFMEPVVARIVSVAADLLQGVPHELGCEIIESGIIITGGGALVPGIIERLSQATSIRVEAPPNALDVVILGLRAMLGYQQRRALFCGC
jgi:rod shape-determining protein MreB and related proteins